MRTLCCLVASLLLLGLAAPVAADQHDDLMKEVKALGDALTKAMMADDVDAMLGMYVKDAISLPCFSPRMDGVEAIRKSHDEMAAAGMKIHSFESEPTDVWQAGSQVIEIGTYAISLTPPGMPGPVDDNGKYMTVWVRQPDGSLKVKVETWNTDMDPMAMGMMGDDDDDDDDDHDEEEGHGHDHGHGL